MLDHKGIQSKEEKSTLIEVELLFILICVQKNPSIYGAN